jgi:hypothetical protein
VDELLYSWQKDELDGAQGVQSGMDGKGRWVDNAFLEMRQAA